MTFITSAFILLCPRVKFDYTLTTMALSGIKLPKFLLYKTLYKSNIRHHPTIHILADIVNCSNINDCDPKFRIQGY